MILVKLDSRYQEPKAVYRYLYNMYIATPELFSKDASSKMLVYVNEQ